MEDKESLDQIAEILNLPEHDQPYGITIFDAFWKITEIVSQVREVEE